MAAAIASEDERWRVFVAIGLPDAIQVRVQEAIDGLAPLRDWVRSNAVDRIHLTLHFLGHISAADVNRLTAPLQQVVAEYPALALSARGAGAFPNLGRAQVLWAGVAGKDLSLLTTLQADLGAVLVANGISVEDRQFHPHLTLARVRRPIRGPGRKLLNEWHQRWRNADFGEFTATDVHLMRSQLGAGPPRYTNVATFSLQ